MATTVSSTAKITINWSSQKDVTISVDKDERSVSVEASLSESAIYRVFRAQRTITVASGTDDLDLTALTDPHGDSINFTKVYFLYVENADTTSGETLLVGGEGSADAWSEPWNDVDSAQSVVGPSGGFMLLNGSDGYSVGAGNKLLRLELAGGTSSSRTYNIVILGEI